MDNAILSEVAPWETKVNDLYVVTRTHYRGRRYNIPLGSADPTNFGKRKQWKLLLIVINNPWWPRHLIDIISVSFWSGSLPLPLLRRGPFHHTRLLAVTLTGTKGKSGTEPFSTGSKFESPEAHFSTSWCLDPLLKLRSHLFSTGQWHHPILKGDI